MSFIVAIDGPAGSGKGTITKLVSEKFNLINIDTGAMYRSVTLACLENNVTDKNLDKIEKILKHIKIDLKKVNNKQVVLLNGRDVTKEIRTTKVDDNVAKFAALKIVRDKMTPLQQNMGSKDNIIMEGRDIGTVVFPNADVKIFLDCSLEERANRRYKQNIEKGIDCSYEEVLKSIQERHLLETKRKIAPFIKAEDAIYIDSTNLNINQVVDKISKIIEEKIENKKGNDKK